MRSLIVVLLLCALPLFADVKVAAAANISFALPKLIEAFNEEYPAIKVSTTIGSSGKLAAQIAHGANFDLYLSANMSYPKRLTKQGIGYSRVLPYALGELVVVSRKPLHSLKDLTTLTRIAIANPKTAPYGVAAMEVLKHSGLYEKIRSKLIFGESVAQTVGYAMHGADAAFVPRSALFSPHFPKMYLLKIDPSLYTKIEQGVVLLTKTEDAKNFFVFLLSQKAAKILQNYGYRIPE